MRKLYYIETNGYDMVLSLDEDGTIRMLSESIDFPALFPGMCQKEKQRKAIDFLKEIEDDSSWEEIKLHGENIHEMVEHWYGKDDPAQVIAGVEKEL